MAGPVVFSLVEMIDCDTALRKIGAEAISLADAGQRIADWLCVHVHDVDGRQSLAEVLVEVIPPAAAAEQVTLIGRSRWRRATRADGQDRDDPDRDPHDAAPAHCAAVVLDGALPDGARFVLTMRGVEAMPAEVAEMFAPIRFSVTSALLAFVPVGGSTTVEQIADAHLTALSDLLDARTAAAKLQSHRLSAALVAANRHAGELAASRAELAASEALKSAIIESALDGVIGMDASGTITGFNLAAETIFGIGRDDAVGRLLADVIVPEHLRENHRHALERYIATGYGSIVGRRVVVSALHRSGRIFPAELSVTRVPGSDPPVFSGHVRDITERLRHEDELLASRARIAHIARTLQTSLLPPTLPTIARLELAALYRPVTDGLDVGGDFYDAFEIGTGRWAFTLGDVCGKGADAAVITALARYTMRAAVVSDPEPSSVLRRLNDAVHRQHPEQFCTAVCAVVQPDDGRLVLSLGGHPHPLLLRTDGSVERLGTPGLLLGPFADWHGTTTGLTMDPGDLLVLYTDGLTEARRGKEEFSEARLLRTLGGLGGQAASSVVTLLESEVVAFAAEPTDDIAILAIRMTG